MKFPMRHVVLVATLLTVTGCHTLLHPFRHLHANACHKPQPYQTAPSVDPIKIPSGMDVPDTTNALHIPALNEPAPPPRAGAQPCLDEPPSYNVPKPAPTPQA